MIIGLQPDFGWPHHFCIFFVLVDVYYIYMVQRSNPPPPRPWSWVSHSTVPLPPCGVVGVWYGMLSMHGVYGRSSMAERMVCLVCMIGMVQYVWHEWLVLYGW